MKENLHILYGDVPVGSLHYDRKKDEITLVRLTIDRISNSLDETRAMVGKTHDVPFLHTLTDAIAERLRHCAISMD